MRTWRHKTEVNWKENASPSARHTTSYILQDGEREVWDVVNTKGVESGRGG